MECLMTALEIEGQSAELNRTGHSIQYQNFGDFPLKVNTPLISVQYLVDAGII
jgi:hypothetical protein